MIPVLQGATAAGHEVRTHRCDPLRAGLQNVNQVAALTRSHRAHPFARQGERHEDRPQRDAVAFPAHMVDG